MIEGMKIARNAAERCERQAQSFVRARPEREVGMSNERTRSRFELLTPLSSRLCRISANLLITDPIFRELTILMTQHAVVRFIILSSKRLKLVPVRLCRGIFTERFYECNNAGC